MQLSDSELLALAGEAWFVGAALAKGPERLWMSVLGLAHFAVALFRP